MSRGLHLHHHFPDDGHERVPAWAVELIDKIGRITQTVERIMATIDDLAASVESEKTVVDGIVTMLDDLKRKIEEALSGTTLPTAVQQKLDEVFQANEAQKQRLADALVANTPSAE